LRPSNAVAEIRMPGRQSPPGTPKNHHPAARRNGVVDTEKRRPRRNDFSIGLGRRVVFLR
jgi:hypothetical protein